VHVAGSVDPVRDVEVIQTELLLADLTSVEKALERAESQAKTARKEDIARRDFLKRLREHIDAGRPARSCAVPDDQRETFRQLFLLTAKPVMYVANVDEAGLAGNVAVEPLSRLAAGEGSEVVVLCAAIEAEIAQLDEADKQTFLEDLGLTEPGLNRVIRAAYRLLGLQTFFTAGPKEVRAWTVRGGSTAPEAAGEIHTDFQRGFIRAEVIAFDDYVALGGEHGARETGRLRLEGKEYLMREGDVVHFRFNV